MRLTEELDMLSSLTVKLHGQGGETRQGSREKKIQGKPESWLNSERASQPMKRRINQG